MPDDLIGFVYHSHVASLELARLDIDEKNQAIGKLAAAIKRERNLILEANTLDLEASREMAISETLLEWLKLTPEQRLMGIAECLEQLAKSPNPLANQMVQYGHKRVPLGTIALVYEAFPQLALIAIGMCLKVGNSLILKGGNESSHSQKAIAEIAKMVLEECDLPAATAVAAPEGSSLKDLLTQERYLRLVIPYGRPSFVQQVCKQATVSVLPTVMGNCYLYLAHSGSLEPAHVIVMASFEGDPDAVNAIEKVVVHRSWLERGLIKWLVALQKRGMKLRGCDVTVAYCRSQSEHLLQEVGLESEWGKAYLDHTIAIKVVDDLEEAIAWINQYSSGHADVILTDSLSETHEFADRINSSNIYINASNRFKRRQNPQENGSIPISLGMSSLKSRGASRHTGAIGLDSLTTTKRIISGQVISGQVQNTPP
jgi:glutamate-5-semialdehyde dehydrogenase